MWQLQTAELPIAVYCEQEMKQLASKHNVLAGLKHVKGCVSTNDEHALCVLHNRQQESMSNFDTLAVLSAITIFVINVFSTDIFLSTARINTMAGMAASLACANGMLLPTAKRA